MARYLNDEKKLQKRGLDCYDSQVRRIWLILLSRNTAVGSSLVHDANQEIRSSGALAVQSPFLLFMEFRSPAHEVALMSLPSPVKTPLQMHPRVWLVNALGVFNPMKLTVKIIHHRREAFCHRKLGREHRPERSGRNS